MSPKPAEVKALQKSNKTPTNVGASDWAQDFRLLVAAKWLARGLAAPDALKKAGFKGTDGDAMCFARLPQVKAMVIGYKEGAHAVIQGATPLAVQRNLELMVGLHGASAAVQQRAADSILDRGGVPKVSKQLIDKRVEIHDSLGALLGGADAVAILVKRGAAKARKKLRGEVVD